MTALVGTGPGTGIELQGRPCALTLFFFSKAPSKNRGRRDVTGSRSAERTCSQTCRLGSHGPGETLNRG